MVEAALPPLSPEGRSVLQGRYELGRLIGYGTFAKVYLARDLRTGASVAMKVVTKEKILRAGMMEQVKREISVMKMVRHPNVVELYEVMASRSKIYLAMELVRGGDLLSKIYRAGRVREDAARRYFRQLICAVDLCHCRGVYHRDLKLENLLLDEQDNIKIADFGLSALADNVRPDGFLHTACGTPAYVAPEVLGKRGYDGAMADVWSCGVILFALLAGFLPFRDDNLLAMYKKIRRGDFQCPPWFSSDARKLITKLLDPNPDTRITIDKLVETPWFKKSSLPKGLPGPLAVEGEKEGEEPEPLNAFHLISFSEGLDLSPMFTGGERREEGMRFLTREAASAVVTRLEGIAGKAAGRYRVTKSSAARVRLEGEERGKKGKLGVVVDIFVVAPSVLMVAVRKDGGETEEFQQFCSEALRPALEDIIWVPSDNDQITAAA